MLKNEFTIGIYNLIASSSMIRAIIYTVGHIIIAVICNTLITGAPLMLAAADALIEPVINGFWYYLLDKTFVSGAAALKSREGADKVSN